MSSFYTACIRSVLTYAAPVFFHALLKYLKDELVRVEKWTTSIICPGQPYQEAIELVNIVPNIDYCRPSRYALRRNKRFIVPKSRLFIVLGIFLLSDFVLIIYTRRFLVFFFIFGSISVYRPNALCNRAT